MLPAGAMSPSAASACPPLSGSLFVSALNPDDVDLLDYVIFCTASICFFTGSKAGVNTAVVNWAM